MQLQLFGDLTNTETSLVLRFERLVRSRRCCRTNTKSLAKEFSKSLYVSILDILKTGFDVFF